MKKSLLVIMLSGVLLTSVFAQTNFEKVAQINQTSQIESSTFSEGSDFRFDEINTQPEFFNSESLVNDEILNSREALETVNAFVINANLQQFSNIGCPSGTETVISSFNWANTPTAMEYMGGTYYVLKSYPPQLWSINPNNGDQTFIADITGMQGTPTGLAYDRWFGSMYIVFLDELMYTHLGSIDVENGVAYEIGVSSVNGAIVAIEFDGAFNLYGACATTDELVSINVANGETTTIGPVGIDISGGQGMSYDVDNNIMYTISSGDISAFCSVDLNTGAYTQLVDLSSAYYLCMVISREASEISEIDKRAKIDIYPNPSTGNVNIYVEEKSIVSIRDVDGRVIDTYSVNAYSAINLIQPAGLYFVQVESNAGVSTHKLVIQ